MQPRAIYANDAASSSANGVGSQKILSGTPTIGSTVPAMIANNPPVEDVIFSFSGTFSATAEVELSEDGGATWIGPASLTPVGGGNAVTTMNAPGVVSVAPGVATNARARCTAYSNGSMMVSILPGIPPALPDAPRLSATPAPTSILLQWQPVPGAVSYKVYSGTATGTETLLVSGEAGPTYNNTGLTANTAYFYYVTAVNAAGESIASNEVSTKTLPTAPTSLGITAGTFSSALAWTDPSAGAATYNVYRGTAAGLESTTPIATGITTTSYTDTIPIVSIGTTYYYVVRAVNSAGGIGAASNEVSGATTGQAAPTSVLATPGDDTNVITWVAASGAVTYNLYRGTAAGKEAVAPIATGLTGTSHTDSGLDPAVTYYYKMTALGAVNQSVKSNETSGRPTAAAPTGVTATVLTGTTVKIDWTAAVGAVTYNLYRGTTPGGESGTPVATLLTGTTHTDTGLSGSVFYYRMKSVNPTGVSATYSNEVSVNIGEINLVVGGDSRFAPDGPVAPDQVFDTITGILPGTATTTNTAVNSRGWLDNSNGGSTLGVISQFQTEVAPLFDNTKRNILCIACDVNDYAFWPIDQVAGAAFTGVQLARATGFEVVLNGPIDAVGGTDNTPPKDWHATDRAVLQGYYVTDNTVGADQSLDVFGDVTVLDDASIPANFPDGVHPSVAASTLWGDYLGPIIDASAGGDAPIANHTVFQDTFAGTNATNLNVHVPTDGTNPTGTPWIYDTGGGTYTIQSNKCQVATIPLSPLGFAIATAEVGASDVLISAVVNFGTSTGNIGLVARHATHASFWLAIIKTTGMYILERVSDAFVTRGFIAHAFSASTNYTMTLQTDGVVIQATADSVSVTCANMTTSLDNTQCGIYTDTPLADQTFDTYLLKVQPTPLAGPYTLATDHFTGADDTNLTAHTMNVGIGWTAGEGVFEIQSNKAALITLGGDSFSVYVTEVSIKDVTITCVVNLGASGAGGVAFRYTDTSHFWSVILVEGIAKGLTIYENAGGFTKKADVVCAVSFSTAYNLSIVISGATVAATLSGGDLGAPVTVSYNTMASNLTATKVGLFAELDVTVVFDDFVVTTP